MAGFDLKEGFMKIEKSPKMICGTLLLVFSHQNQKTMRVINLAS